MPTWQRIGYGIFSTIALMIGGLIYNEVFVAELLPLIDTTSSSPFITPVVWLDRLAPLILVILLLAVWAWVVAGAVQEERRRDVRRVR